MWFDSCQKFCLTCTKFIWITATITHTHTHTPLRTAGLLLYDRDRGRLRRCQRVPVLIQLHPIRPTHLFHFGHLFTFTPAVGGSDKDWMSCTSLHCRFTHCRGLTSVIALHALNCCWPLQGKVNTHVMNGEDTWRWTASCLNNLREASISSGK